MPRLSAMGIPPVKSFGANGAAAPGGGTASGQASAPHKKKEFLDMDENASDPKRR